MVTRISIRVWHVCKRIRPTTAVGESRLLWTRCEFEIRILKRLYGCWKSLQSCDVFRTGCGHWKGFQSLKYVKVGQIGYNKMEIGLDCWHDTEVDKMLCTWQGVGILLSLRIFVRHSVSWMPVPETLRKGSYSFIWSTFFLDLIPTKILRMFFWNAYSVACKYSPLNLSLLSLDGLSLHTEFYSR